MILIAGVTGRVGRATATQLLVNDQVAHVRGLTRDVQCASQLGLDELELVQGDMADRASLTVALRGVDSALLVVGNSEQQFELERNFIEAAASSGVQHVVKISSMEAAPDASGPIPQLHYSAESLIKRQSFAWTMLQPNYFAQNFLLFAQSIKAQSKFALPFGQARVAPVDCADVGAAAAAILSEPSKHAGKTYQLTASELYSFDQLAQIMSEQLGRKIDYQDQSPAAFEAFLAQFIPSPWHVDAVCRLFAQIKQGALESTNGDLQSLVGREPTSFASFVDRHRTAFDP